MTVKTESTSSSELSVRLVGDIVNEIIKAYKGGQTMKLMTIRKKVYKKYKVSTGPKLVEIIAHIPEEYKQQLLPMLKAKPVRTASGIAVVAVMCKPHRCPHIAMTGNICVYCFVGDTPIPLPSGISLPLSEVVDSHSPAVLSYDSNTELVSSHQVTNWANQGVKECIELLFNDGQSIRCTPDHQFLTVDGKWMQAQDLVLNETKIIASVQFPVVNLRKETAGNNWTLDLSSTLGYALNLTNHVYHSLAFCRILGWLLTDGHMSKCDNACQVYMGTRYEADIILDDIELLTGLKPDIIENKAVFEITLPQPLANAYEQVGVKKGSRLASITNYPSFIMDAQAPICLVREFVGGLFGGDGSTMDFAHSNKRFTGLSFTLSKSGACVWQQSQVTKNELLPLLDRLGMAVAKAHIVVIENLSSITSKQEQQTAAKKAQGEVLHPTINSQEDIDENKTYTVKLQLAETDVPKFADNIGFRYSAHKQMRLTAANCWYRQMHLINEQRELVRQEVRKYLSEHGFTKSQGVQIAAAMKHAIEVVSSNVLLHPEVQGWKLTEDRLRFPNQDAHPQITAIKALDEFDIRKFFSQPRKTKRYQENVSSTSESSKQRPRDEDDGEEEACEQEQECVEAASIDKVTYAAVKDDPGFRTFHVKVINKRKLDQAQNVFDITVPSTQAFLAGKVVVHNCPGGPDSDFEYSTQSYTGYEPTSMRAIRARYNPYLQTRNRIEQLKRLGHDADKVEFIIMGGTFMSLSREYRDYFIRNLHDALSGHSSENVAEAVKYSEQSTVKCIGITIETRPDYCLRSHLSDMLLYGCTRLEIGVQSIYEDIARDTNRGHTVAAVAQCFSFAKDAGFKVVSHMMPDLPNSDMERDIEGFKELFENPAFRPDGLKIYPTLVIRGTGLYELWKTGKYKNYPPDALVDLVARILSLIPPWTRVYRIQRDIPMPLVTSGVDHGNLRELALARMRDLGLKCRDVRTREVGIQHIHHKVRPDQVELIRRDYHANGGWETFLSYEDPEQDILIGLLRLRKCSSETFREELTKDGIQASIVRELHVYGSVVPVHERDPIKFQHQGYGTMLMEEAERIARDEHGSQKLAVISGVGTRNYYRKLGYELDGPYVSKMLV